MAVQGEAGQAASSPDGQEWLSRASCPSEQSWPATSPALLPGGAWASSEAGGLPSLERPPVPRTALRPNSVPIILELYQDLAENPTFSTGGTSSLASRPLLQSKEVLGPDPDGRSPHLGCWIGGREEEIPPPPLPTALASGAQRDPPPRRPRGRREPLPTVRSYEGGKQRTARLCSLSGPCSPSGAGERRRGFRSKLLKASAASRPPRALEGRRAVGQQRVSPTLPPRAARGRAPAAPGRPSPSGGAAGSAPAAAAPGAGHGKCGASTAASSARARLSAGGAERSLVPPRPLPGVPEAGLGR